MDKSDKSMLKNMGKAKFVAKEKQDIAEAKKSGGSGKKPSAPPTKKKKC